MLKIEIFANTLSSKCYISIFIVTTLKKNELYKLKPASELVVNDNLAHNQHNLESQKAKICLYTVAKITD